MAIRQDVEPVERTMTPEFRAKFEAFVKDLEFQAGQIRARHFEVLQELGETLVSEHRLGHYHFCLIQGTYYRLE